MSIATRTGDDGTTGLLYGQRVAKNHPQIEAAGAFDELNVAIGAVRLHALSPDLSDLLLTVQQNLVALMGEVACPEGETERFLASKFERIVVADVERLDQWVAAIESRLPAYKDWATPGSSPLAVALDQARVVARRGERRLVALSEYGRSVRVECRHFVNRLSDLLWLLAREVEQAESAKILPNPV